jgi:parallel beta-helix repeat protein
MIASITTATGPDRRTHAVRRLGAAGAVLTCLLQLSSARQAAATTYYVDNTNPACSNSGSGTAAVPYCTISAAASKRAAAGNTIIVVAGTYREQVSVPGAGAAGSPLEFTAGTPAVTIDGADDFSAPALWTQVSGDVWLAGSVTWAPKQVFADQARLAASTAAPASMPAGSFQYVSGTGLYVNAGGESPASHDAQVGHRSYGFTMFGRSWVNLRGFNVTRAEDKGIQLQGGSNQCEITDNRVSLCFKFGIQLNGSANCLLARNVSSDNGGHGIALTAGSTGCTIEDNESCRNADPATRVANGLYLFGSGSNLIRRNRWHDNQDTGEHLQSSSNGCISLQNLSWNNGDHGYDHLGATGTIHANDVAWGNHMDGFSIEGNASGTQLHNCIAVENGLTTNEFDLWVDQGSSAGFVSNDNIFWNSTAQSPVKYVATLYSNVSDYTAVSGQDTRTLQADPLLVAPGAGDFHLRSDSPAIDAADSDAPNWPALDADGRVRMNDPATPDAGLGAVAFADRGAFEFVPLPVTARLTVAQLADQALTVSADGSGSVHVDTTQIDTYEFDFGDGTAPVITQDAIAAHRYPEAGIYTVRLTATGSDGYTSVPVTRTITVNGAPVARLAVTQVADPALTASADASASTDADPLPIATYRFDFGDGSAAVTTTAPAAVARHTYAAAGTYLVTVTVTDQGGLVSDATSPVTVDGAPVARLAVTGVVSPPLTVSADGAASTDADGTPIASYRFDFGDGTPVVTATAPIASAQHTYAGPGVYDVRLVATDTGGFASAPAVARATVAAAIERRVALGSDDAEEAQSGKSVVNGNDLELVTDGAVVQTVGMRWSAVAIPPRAIITAAWIQFASKENWSAATSLTIRGQAADNAATFTTAKTNLSARPRTAAAASWSPAAWTKSQVGPGQRTPDLAAAIQEIVNRPGWASGNALAILITGSGRRTAYSFEGSKTLAPLLHIEYAPLPAAGPVAEQAPSPDSTVSGTRAAAVREAPIVVSGGLSLSIARPNPTAGPVSFRLELPARSTVRWAVYDVQGRALWDEERMFEAGRIDLSWSGQTSDGRRAGPGVYFARVRASGALFTRRFIRL